MLITYVVQPIVNQTVNIQHSTILYLNHAVADFAEALASKMPSDLKVVFFTNSGTEANELAMMIARLYTGCQDIISLRNAYHGNAAGTMGATAMCNWKFNIVQVVRDKRTGKTKGYGFVGFANPTDLAGALKEMNELAVNQKLKMLQVVLMKAFEARQGSTKPLNHVIVYVLIVMPVSMPRGRERPKFLQLYIYDTDHEVDNRLSHFRNGDTTRLRRDIVEGLTHLLDEHNKHKNNI